MPCLIHRIAHWLSASCLSGVLSIPHVLADDPASQQLRDQQHGLRQMRTHLELMRHE